MKKICVDFDGVIYPNMRYLGAGILLEKPVSGAKEGLINLSKNYEVVVHSSRCAEDEGMKAIREWLGLHDMDYPVVRDKPVATVYIDDRAVCFRGDWIEIVEEVNTFKPWQFGVKASVRRNHRRRK